MIEGSSVNLTVDKPAGLGMANSVQSVSNRLLKCLSNSQKNLVVSKKNVFVRVVAKLAN